MLFKSLFLAALLIGISAIPVPDGSDTTTAPAPAPHATDPTKLAPPSVTKSRSELAAAILSIMLHNRVGGIPVQCMPHKTFDALICNFASVLTDDQIKSGVDEVKNMTIVGFESIQYVSKTKKGNSIIKWGSCKSHDGTPQTWNPALGLTRIFGGKSCTILHLSVPPPAMQQQAAVAQQAVKNLLNSVQAGGAGATGATGATGSTSGTSGTSGTSTDSSSGSSSSGGSGWVKGADGKWTKPSS